MNKYAQLGLITLTMGISLSGWSAGNPCLPIAQACMEEGYYKGGNKEGKGLVENCVLPIVAHKKTLPNTAFSESTLQQCKALLMEKMKEGSTAN